MRGKTPVDEVIAGVLEYHCDHRWDAGPFTDSDGRCPHCGTMAREIADKIEPIIARKAAAKVLYDLADATQFPNDWIMFRREDGSGVSVSDLLRETAWNYLADERDKK